LDHRCVETGLFSAVLHFRNICDEVRAARDGVRGLSGFERDGAIEVRA
jgi:hypothetical protein